MSTAQSPTDPVTHDLKCWPEYFERVWDGSKPFEYRRNDRSYKVGDTLLLREWVPEHGKYTNRELRKLVTYVLEAKPDGYVIMGLSAGAREREYFPLWLRKDGDNRFIVAIEIDGKWIDVIHEFDGGGGMSHIVEPAGIKARIEGEPGVKP